MEKGWERPWEESVPPWGRQRGSFPPVSPYALWCPWWCQVQRGTASHGASMARVGPVCMTVPRGLTPRGDASLPSPLVGCSCAGWVPSSRGLETGCLQALCTFGSFKSQALGGFLCLSPFTHEPGTPLLSSAAASPASALTAPSLSSQGRFPAPAPPFHPGPFGSTQGCPGTLGSHVVGCDSDCPPRKKTG